MMYTRLDHDALGWQFVYLSQERMVRFHHRARLVGAHTIGGQADQVLCKVGQPRVVRWRGEAHIVLRGGRPPPPDRSVTRGYRVLR